MVLWMDVLSGLGADLLCTFLRHCLSLGMRIIKLCIGIATGMHTLEMDIQCVRKWAVIFHIISLSPGRICE